MRQTIIFSITIIVLIGLLYFPIRHAEFSGFDDTILITNKLNKLKADNVTKYAFTTTVFDDKYTKQSNYRPLLTLSFALDASLAGDSLSQYFVTNIALHIIATTLFFTLLIYCGISKESSTLASLIFATHPALMHAVAWVPGRNDILLTIFILGSLHAYLRWRRHKVSAYLALHIALFGAALFTKESAIVLPLVIAGTEKFLKNDTKIVLSRTLALSWAAVTLTFLGIRQVVLSQYTQQAIIASVSKSLPNLAYVPIYMAKLALPLKLSTYPMLADTSWLQIGAGVLAFSVFIYYAYKKIPKATLVSLAAYLFLIAPSLIPVDIEQSHLPMLEHRQYLAALSIVTLLALLTERVRSKKSHKYALLCALVLINILATHHRLPIYLTSKAYWQNAIETSPSAVQAYNNLGVIYSNEEDYQQAEANFRKAIELNPQDAYGYGNLGVVYMNQGKYEAAIDAYHKQIAVRTYPEVMFNLGRAYNESGNIEEAIKSWKLLTLQYPDYPQAHLVLTQAYLIVGDDAQAYSHYLNAKDLGIEFQSEIEDIFSQYTTLNP